MTVRGTSQIGEKIIRSRSRKVLDANDVRIQKIILDLIDSMHHNGLVGMAAPQIGVGLRIFVSHPRETVYRRMNGYSKTVRVFINPRIITKSKSHESGYEGCGSVANATLFGLVLRCKSITVTATDRSGKKFTLKASGLLARIIQHEIDHLDGIVFLDRMKSMRELLDRETYLGQEK